MCCPALFADEDQVLAFFSASPQASYGGGNVLMQRSTDSGTQHLPLVPAPLPHAA